LLLVLHLNYVRSDDAGRIILQSCEISPAPRTGCPFSQIDIKQEVTLLMNRLHQDSGIPYRSRRTRRARSNAPVSTRQSDGYGE
jgi:hypothetical protein